MYVRLNNEQRIVLTLTAVALVGLLLFPPYYTMGPWPGGDGTQIIVIDSGIGFVGALPEYQYDSDCKATINIPYLITGIVTILIASGLIVLTKGRKFKLLVDKWRAG